MTFASHRYVAAVRARFRLFHRHHARRVGRAGVFGEVVYHVAELADFHSGIVLAAVVLLAVTVFHLFSGEA